MSADVDLERAQMALAEAGYDPACAFIHPDFNEVWMTTYDENGPWVPVRVAEKVAEVCGFRWWSPAV